MNTARVARSQSGKAKNGREQSSGRREKSTPLKAKGTSAPSKVTQPQHSAESVKANETSSANLPGPQRDKPAAKASKLPARASDDHKAWAMGEALLMRVPELNTGGVSPLAYVGEGVLGLGEKLAVSGKAAGEAAKGLWEDVFTKRMDSTGPDLDSRAKEDESQGNKGTTVTDATTASQVDNPQGKSKRKGLGPPSFPTHVHVDRLNKNVEIPKFFNVAYHARERYRSKQLPGLDAGLNFKPAKLKQASKGFEQFFEDLVGPLHESDAQGKQGKAIDVPQFTSDLFSLAKTTDVEGARLISKRSYETRQELAAASASNLTSVPHVEAIYSDRARADFQELADGLYSDLFLADAKEVNPILDETKAKWAQILLIGDNLDAPVGLKISSGQNVAIPFSQFFEDFIQKGKFAVTTRFPIDFGVIGSERLQKYVDTAAEEGYSLPEEPRAAGHIEVLYGDGRAADFQAFGKELQRRLSSGGADKERVIDNMYQRLKDALGLGQTLNGIVGVRLSGNGDAIPIPFETFFDNEVRAPIERAQSFPSDFGAMTKPSLSSYLADVESSGISLPELTVESPSADFSPKAGELVSGLEQSPLFPKYFVNGQGRVMDVQELFWKVHQTREAILNNELGKYPFRREYPEKEKQNKLNNHSELFQQQLGGQLWASDAQGNKASEPLNVWQLVQDLYGAATPYDLSWAAGSVGRSTRKELWADSSIVDEIESVNAADGKHLGSYAIQYMIQKEWPPQKGDASATLEKLKGQMKNSLGLSSDESVIGVMTIPYGRLFSVPFGRFWEKHIAAKLDASPDFFPLDLNFLPADTTKAFQRDAQRDKLPLISPVSDLQINRERVEEGLKNGKSYPIKYVAFVDPNFNVHSGIVRGFGSGWGKWLNENDRVQLYDVKYANNTATKALRYDVDVLKLYADRKLARWASSNNKDILGAYADEVLEQEASSVRSSMRSLGENADSKQVAKLTNRIFKNAQDKEIERIVQFQQFGPRDVHDAIVRGLRNFSKEVMLYDAQEDQITSLRPGDWLDLFGLPISEEFQSALRAEADNKKEASTELALLKINGLPFKLGNEISAGVVNAWNAGTMEQALEALTGEIRRLGGKRLPPVKSKTDAWLGFRNTGPIGVKVGRLYTYLQENNKGLDALTPDDAAKIQA